MGFQRSRALGFQLKMNPELSNQTSDAALFV
jgi:hypothetical protein